MNTRILIAVVVSMFVCKQLCAQTVDDPVMPEATELEGTWEVVSATMGGVEEDPQGRQCRFEGSMRYWTIVGHENWSLGQKFSVDPSAMPAEIDVEYTGWSTLGIYELDGNILRLCYSRGEGADREIRPDRFVSTADYQTAL